MPVIDIKPINNLEFTDKYIKNKEKTDSDIWDIMEDGQEYQDALRMVMNYAAREDKVLFDKHYYVSGINCDPDNSVSEFMRVQKLYGKYESGIVAHHGWQSFPKGYKISPEDAHNFCVEWLSKTLGDRFQIVVTTHVDREHIHSHFIINAVSFRDGYKFYGNQETLWALRRASDELCLKYGYPIIQNPNYYGKNQGLYRAELRGETTWRDLVKKDIDLAIAGSRSMTDFYRDLEARGYLIRRITSSGEERKHPSVSPPGMVRKDGSRIYIRFKSLNDPMYLPEGIENRIRTNLIFYYPSAPRYKRAYARKRKRKPLPRSVRRYYRFMYQVGLMKRKPRRMSYYSSRQYSKEAKSATEALAYLRRYKIDTDQDLLNRINELNKNERLLANERRRLSTRQKKGEDVSKRISEITEERYIIRKEKKLCEQIKNVTEKDWAGTLDNSNPDQAIEREIEKRRER